MSMSITRYVGNITYLKKEFTKNPICFVLENGGKDDGNAIMRSSDVDCLLVPIMNLHQLSLFISVREFFLSLESKLKRRRDGIAFEHRYRHDKRFPCLW